jgi:orotidine-5'-phosphate decarboxylase
VGPAHPTTHSVASKGSDGPLGSSLSARDRLVFPLDVPNLDAASVWVDRLAEQVGVFKVGLELFTAEGPEAVRRVHAAGCACFLDLKLHDIPATVASAVTAAAELGVRYLTVHASSGPAALQAAAAAAQGTGTRLLAVTVLTSMGPEDLGAIGLQGTPEEAVLRLARMAAGAGIDGFVTSPHECQALRQAVGQEALLVVPGVRPASSALDDQRRAATPADAVRAGADLLVVGRPIRNASNPVAAARAIAADIAGQG